MLIRVALVGLAQTFVVQLSVSLQVALIRGLLWVTDVEQFCFVRERHSTHGVSECLLFRSIDEADELLFPNIEDPIVKLQKVYESTLESFICQVYLAELEGSLELLEIHREIPQLRRVLYGHYERISCLVFLDLLANNQEELLLSVFVVEFDVFLVSY